MEVGMHLGFQHGEFNNIDSDVTWPYLLCMLGAP